MKCEGSRHIQDEYANTGSDDESEECNEGENLCNESVAPVNISATKRCWRDPTISASGAPVDPSTYESPT